MGKERQLTIIILAVWTGVVGLLFLHGSGLLNISFLAFPQSRGNLIFLEEYKQTNILGLGKMVLAIPHGGAFVHPKRAKKLREENIFVASSLQEAKRMVDAGGQELVHVLKWLDVDYKSISFLRMGDKIYGVPQINAASGNPTFVQEWFGFEEKLIGSSMQEAREWVDGERWLNK